jgi:hypothetical protein
MNSVVEELQRTLVEDSDLASGVYGDFGSENDCVGDEEAILEEALESVGDVEEENAE